MATARSLLPDDPPAAGNGPYAARVSRADPVEVTVNSYGTKHKWEPVTWMSPDEPERGDHCLLFVDDQGHYWAFGIPA